MLIRPQCLALMTLLCLGLSACSPTSETQLDEQRNPHYLAGREKLGALDYKGAIESFERAVEDNPRSALAHFELGVLYELREADYAAALYHYNKALKLRPTGNPAENIRQRIPACKQELVKADSLAIINPSVLRETEMLRTQNAALRSQLEQLQAQLVARPPASAGAGQNVSPTREPSAPGAMIPGSVSSASAHNPRPAPVTSTTNRVGSPAASTGRTRTHSVKAGETATSIARQYSIKPGALLSANPGLDPRRMRIGQVLNVPAS